MMSHQQKRPGSQTHKSARLQTTRVPAPRVPGSQRTPMAAQENWSAEVHRDLPQRPRGGRAAHAKFCKLVAADGEYFRVPTPTAIVSNLVAYKLVSEAPRKPADAGEDVVVHLPNIAHHTLSRVLEFCTYHTTPHMHETDATREMRQRIRDANRAAGTNVGAHADANDNDRAGSAAGASADRPEQLPDDRGHALVDRARIRAADKDMLAVGFNPVFREIEKPMTRGYELREYVDAWDVAFVERQSAAELRLLFYAANYMDIKPLFELICAHVACQYARASQEPADSAAAQKLRETFQIGELFDSTARPSQALVVDGHGNDDDDGGGMTARQQYGRAAAMATSAELVDEFSPGEREEWARENAWLMGRDRENDASSAEDDDGYDSFTDVGRGSSAGHRRLNKQAWTLSSSSSSASSSSEDETEAAAAGGAGGRSSLERTLTRTKSQMNELGGASTASKTNNTNKKRKKSKKDKHHKHHAEITAVDVAETCRNLFEECDVSHAGQLTPEEFHDLLTLSVTRGRIVLETPFTDDEVEQVVHVLDTDGDGLVDEDELVAWLRSGFESSIDDRAELAAESPLFRKLDAVIEGVEAITRERRLRRGPGRG